MHDFIILNSIRHGTICVRASAIAAFALSIDGTATLMWILGFVEPIRVSDSPDEIQNFIEKCQP